MGNNLFIEDEAYFKKLKKKETFPLHIHWDGAIPAEHLYSLAQKRGQEIILPEKDLNGKVINYPNPASRLIHTPDELYTFLTDFKTYNIIDIFNVPIRFMQTKKDLISAAIAHCKYLKSQNSPYAETRFAPQYHTVQGLSMEEVIEHSVEGFYIGNEITGVDVRLLICIGREAEPELGIKVAEAAIALNKKYPEMVLGLDLACDEFPYPPEKHYLAFEKTFDTPLKRTVHAGEMCGEEQNLRNIRSAVYELRADALGHAIPLYKDENLIEAVIERKIRIESNPLSNLPNFIERISDLHLDDLVEAGVLITINPDDPAMIANGDLVHNLYHLGNMYGNDFVNTVIRNSIESAWGLSQEQKDTYLKAG